MELEITIKAILTLPEGTKIPDDGRAFALPSGDWVKPFIVLERNDDEDLSYDQMVDAELDLHEIEIEWVEI